ncbi:hypothetical protein [Meiothermus granaticius]|uniref:LPS export ABC transporter periplasmic protein LptC n=1 Tax=Meiothermus granaticius NBRC 107808 TaxID=1227551 RepID=A0A399FAB3_9DEIN|nr:hypothetical protein [Meiothermus granaticius]RIH93053.1 hypothetical protein Mgrana_01012 [Meiothermus granaticius NBRC 107808]GEM86672.1 hypothetical protein MGR01S_12970 [Meiothermus granaticius NBRC 107808]
MVRTALIALAVIVALSVFLVTRPVPPPPTPPQGVRLENVHLTLYPEQDPKARWEFSAAEVEQDPGTREARVSGLQTGQRYVENTLELRLFAPVVTIDRQDNLRLPYAKVEILKGCYSVQLGAAGQSPVTIDQRQGFKAPSVLITSPTIQVDGVNFTSDFGIQNPSWNVRKETFITGGEPQPCTIQGGSQ